MERQTTVFASAAVALRMARLWAVGLVASALVAVAMADEADASYGWAMADSDGYVPIYSSCWAGTQVGLYESYSDGYAVYGTIYVNDCALANLGAGAYDRQRVIDHEYGHAFGVPHSYDLYDYMYPQITITGT